MRFAEDIDGIFEDRLQKGRTGHFTNDSGNRNTDQRHASGWPKRARNSRERDHLDELVSPLSQEGQKQTHRSTRQMFKEMVLV